MKFLLQSLTAALLLAPVIACAEGLERTPAPEGAKVYFVTPHDGATVASPIRIRFGLKGMGVAPAGVDHDRTGHHHLLIDFADEDVPPMDMPLPTTDHVVHFGGGQTETEIELEEGKHTLQLLLGDHRHVPHDPAIKSERITVTVEE